jgi:hypothetical protein
MYVRGMHEVCIHSSMPDPYGLKTDLNLTVSIDYNKFSFLTAEVRRLQMEKSVTPVNFCSERNNESEVRAISQYGHRLSLST